MDTNVGFNNCELLYFEKWDACNIKRTLPQAEFDAWLAEHCYKCPHMSDICMWGEN